MEQEKKNASEHPKKPYNTPQLTVHGDIETMTLGQGIGIRDIFIYGLADPIGRGS